MPLRGFLEAVFANALANALGAALYDALRAAVRKRRPRAEGRKPKHMRRR